MDVAVGEDSEGENFWRISRARGIFRALPSRFASSPFVCEARFAPREQRRRTPPPPPPPTPQPQFCRERPGQLYEHQGRPGARDERCQRRLGRARARARQQQKQQGQRGLYSPQRSVMVCKATQDHKEPLTEGAATSFIAVMAVGTTATEVARNGHAQSPLTKTTHAMTAT